MKLSKRHRASVVALLRCGADMVDRAAEPLRVACKSFSSSALGPATAAFMMADLLCGSPLIMLNTTRRWLLLYAAARVEEGSWT